MIKNHILVVAGSFVIDFDRYEDDRGFFQEIFSTHRYSPEFPEVAQVNISHSNKNVIRGMHVAPFAKLCTCIRGSLWDVVADVRKDSPTFGNYYGVWLTEENKKQLYVPSGCAHGFFAAEDNTILCYQQDGLYNPKFECEIHYKDPTLQIAWPNAQEYIVSEKDQNAKDLQSALAFLNSKKNSP
jgi:dTDP-4-dehydrorhamnose 3,5-epimerase